MLFHSKKVAIGLSVAASLISPSVAQADIFTEMAAANRVEQKVVRAYPGYDPVATCDQQGRRFWCSFIADKGHCYLSGRAWAVRYPWRVSFASKSRYCIGSSSYGTSSPMQKFTDVDFG